MKKQYRIAIIAGPEHLSVLNRTAQLSFGKENVLASMNPGELLAISERLHPTTLLIDPDLLYFYNISPNDVAALKHRFRFHIICVCSETPKGERKEILQKLKPEKTFVCPSEYITLMSEIPLLSTNQYVKFREPIINQATENLEYIFTECGFHCNAKGYRYLKESLFMILFNPELQRYGGAKHIYHTLAEKYNDTPRIVARSMIRFLENSLSSPNVEEKFREMLKIPEHTRLFPISFLNFTGIFTAYYGGKFGDPIKLLVYKRRR